MLTEQEGQKLGRKCWRDGLSLEETMKIGASECGIESVPEDARSWPRFLHGVEEAWQDKNLEDLDRQHDLSQIRSKHVKTNKDQN